MPTPEDIPSTTSETVVKKSSIQVTMDSTVTPSTIVTPIVSNTSVGMITSTASTMLTTSSTNNNDDTPISDSIALNNKPTNQTGNHQGLYPSKLAVDGKLDDPAKPKINCARPDNPIREEPAEWWLNLEALYLVSTITVHNTYDYWAAPRLSEFTFGVIYPGEPEVTCGYQRDAVPIGANVTFTCSDDVIGQFIHFIRLGGPEIYRVTLCEVQVTGLELVAPIISDQDIDVLTKNSTTIGIQWNQISVYSQLSKYYGYVVLYGPENDQDNQKVLHVAHDGRVSVHSVILTDLTYNTVYQVKIQPYLEIKGDNTTGTELLKIVKTNCQAPDPPEMQNYTTEIGTDGMQIGITYKLKDFTGCYRIIHVWVEYKKNDSHTWQTQELTVPQAGESLIANINVPTPGTYLVRLHVRNNERQEATTDILQVTVGKNTRIPTTTDFTPLHVSSKRTTMKDNTTQTISRASTVAEFSTSAAPTSTMATQELPTTVGTPPTTVAIDEQPVDGNRNDIIYKAVVPVIIVIVIAVTVIIVVYMVVHRRHTPASPTQKSIDTHTFENDNPQQIRRPKTGHSPSYVNQGLASETGPGTTVDYEDVRVIIPQTSDGEQCLGDKEYINTTESGAGLMKDIRHTGSYVNIPHKEPNYESLDSAYEGLGGRDNMPQLEDGAHYEHIVNGHAS